MKCSDCKNDIKEGQEVACYIEDKAVYRCFDCMKNRNQEILKNWVIELRNR